jgi:hypothetical protein
MALPSTRAAAQLQWNQFGDMAYGRNFFEALPIGNGRALVIGGYGSGGVGHDGYYMPVQPITSCEIIDVANHSITATGSLNVPHAEFTALLTPDSNVVAISGVTANNQGLTPVVELYDRATGRWRVIGSLLVERRQHTACFINRDEFLVVGGRHVDLSSMATAEIFNIRTGRSRLVHDYPDVINTPVSGIASNGDLLVFGGREGGAYSHIVPEIYKYDVARDRWVLVDSFADPINAPQLLKLWNGSLLVSGGALVNGYPMVLSGKVHMERGGVFDTWANMSVGRIWHSMAQFSDDAVIVTGGWLADRDATNGCDWLDLRDGSVHPAPAMRHARKYFHTLAIPVGGGEVSDMKVIAIGGEDETNATLSSVEILGQECPESATIEASGPLTFCEGSTVVLTAPDGPFMYRWSTGATSRAIVVANSGSYSVTLSSELGCRAKSEEVTINVIPQPTRPNVARYGTTLVSTAAVTYQWSLNGTAIPGAINRTFAPHAIGEYTVTITQGGECSSTSLAYVVHDRDLNDMNELGVAVTGESESVKLYPNPVKDLLTLEASIEGSAPVKAELTDILGASVRSIDAGMQSGLYHSELSLRDLPAGTYLLHLHVGAKVTVRKIIKD